MVEKSVIIDYDFAAMNGAEVLFATVRDFLLALDSIPFDDTIEARHFAGTNLHDALAAYFREVKTKKTALKAARDIAAAFVAPLEAEISDTVSVTFRNFVKALMAKGMKVAIVTRADPAKIGHMFSGLLGPKVKLVHEESRAYGFLTTTDLRRICREAKMRNIATAVLTGSGYGAKAAMMAGMRSLAVANPRVAYQDFGPADAVVERLDAAAAKLVFRMMRIQ